MSSGSNTFFNLIRSSVFLTFLMFSINSQGAENTWLLIDTTALTLSVMQEEEAKIVFNNISIGRNGAGFEKQRGDDKTPLGRFRIAWVNNNSRYYRFYGITYPAIEHAKRALARGLIDTDLYRRLIRADIFGETPPQDTPLGGQIGIHGIGEGDANIHQSMNWTHGCVALTNEQIDKLNGWIRRGMVVVIR